MSKIYVRELEKPFSPLGSWYWGEGRLRLDRMTEVLPKEDEWKERDLAVTDHTGEGQP